MLDRAARRYALAAGLSEIVDGVKLSAVFVLVLSENADESIFVKREVERAVSKGKPIFPIRVREVMPSRSLELFISSAHWIDTWKPPIEKYLERLAQSISAAAAVYPAGAAASAPTRPTTARSWPTTKQKRLPTAIAASLVLLLLSGIGWYVYGLLGPWGPGQAEILDKWAATDGSAGPLRSPTSDTIPTFDGVGKFRNFEGGIISWHPETGAHIVRGLIGERWLQIGREEFGYPVTDKYPETGAAHEVYGLIRAKWAEMGWERGDLGYPVGHEVPTFDGTGRTQVFQERLYSWHPETRTHAVWGLINARWDQIGRAEFGYPVTDELPTPDGRGASTTSARCTNRGSLKASIYWGPLKPRQSTRVYGLIRRHSGAEMGWGAKSTWLSNFS